MNGSAVEHAGFYAKGSKLVRYLSVAYLLLVAYTSLYPFTEWRAPNDEVRAFLYADWPHFLTWSDVTLNALAYLPVGALLALMLLPYLNRFVAAVAAALLASALSLAFEYVQIYLPARIPSNVDLLCNSAGAALGAALAAWLGRRWILSGDLRRVRDRWFASGAAVDFGFLLLALWLITQLNAEIWLFGNGDMRHLLPIAPAVGYSARTYLLLEAGVAALAQGNAGVGRDSAGPRAGPEIACLRRAFRVRKPRFVVHSGIDRGPRNRRGDLACPCRIAQTVANRGGGLVPGAGNGAGQRGSGESLSGGNPAGLAARALRSGQRPDSRAVEPVDLPLDRLSRLHGLSAAITGLAIIAPLPLRNRPS
jgi:VanZ family protein